MEKIDETLEKKFKVNEIKRDQMLDKVKTCCKNVFIKV